jgi:hypothetical protein
MPRAATIVSLCIAAVLAAPSAHAGDVVLEVGLRAGWVFGRGLTVGPAVSLVRGGPPTQFFERHVIPLLFGVTASSDVVMGRGGDLGFRLHVGPEVGAIKSCPAFALTLTGGLAVAVRPHSPVRFGVDGGASLLGSEPYDYPDMPSSNLLFVGGAYRYSALLDGERGHEVGLDSRWWSLPFTTANWAGVCGAVGGLQPRLL